MGESDSRPVVVGADGSTSSLAAVTWAAGEAAARGRPLRIVHGFVWPLVRMPDLGPIGVDRAGLRDAAEKVLADSVERARATAPDLPVTSELVTAEAADALVDESARAELVVVGSRGLGGFSGLLVGSVAVAVLSRGDAPVVVVRGRTVTDSSGPVVVGVDGELSEAATEFAFDAASRRGVGLVAVRAWGARVMDILATVDLLRPDSAAAEDQAGRELSDALAVWRERHPEVPVELRMIRDRPASVLMAESDRAQLLVVGSRGGTDLSGLLLGSVSHAAIHHANCPVAVVRPPEGHPA